MKKILTLLIVLLLSVVLISCNQKVYALSLEFNNGIDPIETKITNFPYTVNFEDYVDGEFLYYAAILSYGFKDGTIVEIEKTFETTYTLEEEKLILYNNLTKIIFELFYYKPNEIPEDDTEIELPEYDLIINSTDVSSSLLDAINYVKSNFNKEEFDYMNTEWLNNNYSDFYTKVYKSTTNKLNIPSSGEYETIVLELDLNKSTELLFTNLLQYEVINNNLLYQDQIISIHFNFVMKDNVMIAEFYKQTKQKTKLEYLIVFIKED